MWINWSLLGANIYSWGIHQREPYQCSNQLPPERHTFFSFCLRLGQWSNTLLALLPLLAPALPPLLPPPPPFLPHRVRQEGLQRLDVVNGVTEDLHLDKEDWCSEGWCLFWNERDQKLYHVSLYSFLSYCFQKGFRVLTNFSHVGLKGTPLQKWKIKVVGYWHLIAWKKRLDALIATQKKQNSFDGFFLKKRLNCPKD